MGNGLAIASFILGILGITLGWIPVLGFLFLLGSIIGLILGIVYLNKAKNDPTMTAKGMAISGIILCAISTVFIGLISIGAIAYFGVLDADKFAPKTISVSLPFATVSTPVFSENNIKGTFSYSGDAPITLKSAGNLISEQCVGGEASSITKDGVDLVTGEQINPDEQFTITWGCEQKLKKDTAIRGSFTIEYIDTTTGLTQTSNGMLRGPYR